MGLDQQVFPPALAARLRALFAAGHWPELAREADAATTRYPEQPLGWRALGKAKIAQNAMQEAVSVLTRAAVLIPCEADIHHDLGTAQAAQGRREAAEAGFRRALAIDPAVPEFHVSLGDLLARCGRGEEAVLSYETALSLNPAAFLAHNGLGNVLRELGRLAQAEACYRRALGLSPGFLVAEVNLGTVLADLGHVGEALQQYRRALRSDPNFGPALLALGRLLARLATDDAEAERCLRRAATIYPDDAGIQVDLGNILMRRRDKAGALRLFRYAQEMQPLLTWRPSGATVAFSALLLDSPLAGSTPVDFLVGRAEYERNFFCLISGGGSHDELLRRKADVVFNMISAGDDGGEVLAMALDLVERLGRPTINHPRQIMNSNRASVARRVAASVPGCIVPATVRAAAPALLAACAPARFASLRLPLLLRRAGTHGGDDFDKFDDWDAIQARVARAPVADYYLSEFVDCRSADGLYRKYRFIAVDGAIFPYHLAIHAGWKVHHFRTDMANQAWMRDEEARFLADTGSLFGPDRQRMLGAIAAAVGLDYCGIDCALDRDGRLVLFECNASMRVHDEMADKYGYRSRAAGRIKAAFDAMMLRRAASVGTPARTRRVWRQGNLHRAAVE